MVGPLKGYHHEAYAVLLDEGSALGRGFSWLKLREPRPGVFWYDLRCFRSEEELLPLLRGRVPRIPEVADVADGVSVLSFIEGRTLGTVRPAGCKVDQRHVDQIVELFGSLAAFDVDDLRQKMPCDHDEHEEAADSSGFLKGLISHTIEDVYEPHRPVFDAVFRALGVDDEALNAFADRLPPLTSRPYRLLHGDLHRENFIVDLTGNVWTIDWELARIGDPVYDLATHLHLMRYPPKQEAEVVERWTRVVEDAHPGASSGVREDLPVYLDYKRIQSVYTDIIRGGTALLADMSVVRLAHTARALRRALELARGPLVLERIPLHAEIMFALAQWHVRHRRRLRDVV